MGNPLKSLIFYLRSLRGISAMGHAQTAAFSFMLTFIVVMMIPEVAFAAIDPSGKSFGKALCRVFKNSGYVPGVIMAICSVGAVMLGGLGLLRLKQNAENPNQTKIHQAILPLIVAGALIVLPQAIGAFVDTVYGSAKSGGQNCVAQEQTAGKMALDIMLIKFVDNIKQGWIHLVAAIAYIFGVINIGKGLFKASKYGQDPKAYSMHAIVTNFVFGALLVVLAQTMDAMLTSIYGVGQGGVTQFTGMNWSGAGANGVGTTNADNAIRAAITFLQLIGLLAFLRGWFLLKNSVEGIGQATLGQGFTHVIGGAVCFNMPLFLQAAELTFGVKFTR